MTYQPEHSSESLVQARADGGSTRRFNLLLDQRHPAIQRYLRRLYTDPITGKAEWGLVKGPEDRIIGIYSLSEDPPFKRTGFPIAYQDFEGKKRYRDWQFVYIPAGAQSQQPLQPAQSQPPPGPQQPANASTPETKRN